MGGNISQSIYINMGSAFGSTLDGDLLEIFSDLLFFFFQTSMSVKWITIQPLSCSFKVTFYSFIYVFTGLYRRGYLTGR